MEYIEAKNIRFSEIFQQTELVHFICNDGFSIPDDGILVIKQLGDDLLDSLTETEKLIIGMRQDSSPYLVLTDVKDTDKDAQVAYSGEIMFLDYKPNKEEIVKELV